MSWNGAQNTEVLKYGNTIGDNVSNSKVAVTTSSAVKFSTNRKRTFLALVNPSINYDVWIALGEDAVVGEGMLLSKDNGIIVFDKDAIYKGAIYMIADGGSVNIAYTQATKEIK